MAFYSRNYIEGLFLSSGIIRSSNYTMEQIVEVARSLREDHDFRGYIHLKTIPDADPELVRQAGRYADRVSINVELPTESGLTELAPEKDAAQIEGAMRDMKASIVEASDASARFKSAPKFAPAGQSTQMIVGADAASDADMVGKASALYDRFGLRRVYYSAFSPIPDASAVLPLKRPPLMREHRLYQSDWLMRFYGFAPKEVQSATDANGMLPLDIDPKLAWALKFRENFPVDVNRAPQGDAVARAGTRHEGSRPHPVLAPVAEAGARRCRSADLVDREGAAVHRRGRLAPDAAARSRRPPRAPRAQPAAARTVCSLTVAGQFGSSPRSSIQPRLMAARKIKFTSGLDQPVLVAKSRRRVAW